MSQKYREGGKDRQQNSAKLALVFGYVYR